MSRSYTDRVREGISAHVMWMEKNQQFARPCPACNVLAWPHDFELRDTTVFKYRCVPCRQFWIE